LHIRGYTTRCQARPGEDSFLIQENPMKKMLLAVVLSTCAATAFAQDTATTCKSQATDKKLAGAALKSFMTKCERDAKTSCTTQAADKKLAGAAKTSFTKKCVTDAVGN
jgi:hypothetical protein